MAIALNMAHSGSLTEHWYGAQLLGRQAERRIGRTRHGSAGQIAAKRLRAQKAEYRVGIRLGRRDRCFMRPDGKLPGTCIRQDSGQGVGE
jgi:hypothetical protein